MASLRKLESDRRVLLPDDALIGRSRSCDVVLEHQAASSVHAGLSLKGTCWEIHDLNSRNGTWLDGRRLAREPLPLTAAAQLVFGSRAETWVLEDADPSGLFVRSDAGCLRPEAGVLPLPSEHAPMALVLRTRTGEWCIEGDAGRQPLAHRGELVLAGRIYRCFLPLGSPATEDVCAPSLHDLSLELQVCDGRVRALLAGLGREIDLGVRAHHVVLLTLARARLHDQGLARLPEPQRGWVHRDDVLDAAGLQDSSHLNVMILRLRRQLDGAGIPDAAEIIERQAGLGELRLGPSRVSIHDA